MMSEQEKVVEDGKRVGDFVVAWGKHFRHQAEDRAQAGHFCNALLTAQLAEKFEYVGYYIGGNAGKEDLPMLRLLETEAQCAEEPSHDP